MEKDMRNTHGTIYVGIDVSKGKLAVVIAGGGRAYCVVPRKIPDPDHHADRNRTSPEHNSVAAEGIRHPGIRLGRSQFRPHLPAPGGDPGTLGGVSHGKAMK